MTIAEPRKQTGTRIRSRLDWLLLAGFCGFLFFFGLAYFGLVGADEPRYAQIAREMLDRKDWITPTLGGKPWLEKPVLYYWEAMLSYGIFGVSDWAARLPSAVDASALVLAIYLFLKRFRPGCELDGALISASAAGIIGFARAASTDMPLAAMFGIAMLAWYAWHGGTSRKPLALFYFFLALATLAKGPVAPFLAGLMVLLFAAARRDYTIAWRTLWIPGILIFCAVALPWYVAVQFRNPEFFRTFFIQHNLERFSTNLYRHSQPFWYFILVALLGFIPWSMFLVSSVIATARRIWPARSEHSSSEYSLSIFLLIWFVTPIVFFSISQSKLPGYILPVFPAGTLLVVEFARRNVAASKRSYTVEIVLHSLIASGVLVPALMIRYMIIQHHLPWSRTTLVSSAIALLVGAGIAVGLKLAPGLRMLRMVTLIPVVLALAIILRFGAPLLDATLSARPLVNQIGLLGEKKIPMAVFQVRRETEFGLAFYRNAVISRYELGNVPLEEHLVVAPQGSQVEVAKRVAGRHVSYLGTFAAQKLDYYWVSAW